MKKKPLLFLLFAFLVSTAFLSGCKKDSVSDPADQFVGSYSYSMTITGGITGSDTGDLTVRKTASDKIAMLQTGGTDTYYTVVGNSITEDTQNAEMPISATATATFAENSTGSINGSIVTINGSWTRTGYVTANFKIVMTKK